MVVRLQKHTELEFCKQKMMTLHLFIYSKNERENKTFFVRETFFFDMRRIKLKDS